MKGNENEGLSVLMSSLGQNPLPTNFAVNRFYPELEQN
jgi:hypothetical protein